MAVAFPDRPTDESLLRHPAVLAVLELFPIICAVLGGTIGGVSGTILRDWIVGLICLVAAAGAGLILGLVAQALFSVLLICANVAAEARSTQNYVPLKCGVGAALYVAAQIILDRRANDVGLLMFGIVLSFVLGAGFGGVVQDVVRRVTQRIRSRHPPSG